MISAMLEIVCDMESFTIFIVDVYINYILIYAAYEEIHFSHFDFQRVQIIGNVVVTSKMFQPIHCS